MRYFVSVKVFLKNLKVKNRHRKLSHSTDVELQVSNPGVIYYIPNYQTRIFIHNSEYGEITIKFNGNICNKHDILETIGKESFFIISVIILHAVNYSQ